MPSIITPYEGKPRGEYLSPPVLPEPAAPARLPPAVLWRGWGDDDGPTI
jgi:hypothetical protein